MTAYYAQRAPEYDDWWLSTGLFAARDRPGWQERTLNDGSKHRVFKRWFTAEGLREELGGGEALHDGAWFVAVRYAR